MTKIIFIIGNDGSGKTTYSTRMLERMRASGSSARRIHYYSLSVRSAFRALVDVVSGVSARKLDAEDARRPEPESRSPSATLDEPTATDSRSASGLRALVLITFLYFYQIAMAIELRLRALVAPTDYLVVDRSYIDDLVSVLESFRLETPRRLVGFSSRLFPRWRMIYVSAGPDIEFARIVDVDLSRAVHFGKNRRYQEMAGILETAGAPLRRVDSSRSFDRASEDVREEWE
ncbi:MAG: hypothetical protein CL933_12480 [Deltaproteobacteria bacterium]|nr:hypothetical protein [Deltaproteobacteria bacterium]